MRARARRDTPASSAPPDASSRSECAPPAGGGTRAGTENRPSRASYPPRYTRAMRWPAVLAVLAALAGCGENAASAPFDGLPLDGDFTVGVGAPVHVARDRYGIAHILASSLGDAAFVQGYVTAHDRLPQMEVLRRL